MHPYPEWMSGDQLCAEAERRSDAQEQRDACIEARADALLDAGDWSVAVPGIGSIAEIATCMSDQWYCVQDQIMASLLAGNHKQAAIDATTARQIMRSEIIEQLQKLEP